MSHRSLLARATEGTDAPTPGYLYIDLSKACTGNPNVCTDVASYLTKRLATKQNPNIKTKCAKVIAKLCDSVPRNAFRRCIAQDHTSVMVIKEACQFKGHPDPVRGDTVNQGVRDAAKLALEAVYREAPSSEMVSQNNISTSGYGGGGPSSNSNGYGNNSSNNYGPPVSAQQQQGGRMQGIGNPRYSDPRLDPRYNGEQPQGFQSVVSEAKEVIVGMIKDPLARNVGMPEPPRHSGSYGGPTYGRPPPGSSELARQTGGQWTMASNRGPGAKDYSRENFSSSGAGGVGGSWGAATTPSIHHSNHTSALPSTSHTPAGPAVSDGQYEKNLVMELCPPGGMKAVPPPDKLANFARNCSSLNADLVCPVLLDLIEDGQPWIIRAKALCAMETAIANGTNSTSGDNPYRTFFYACAEEIQPLANHARSAIYEPARRVLRLLGVDAATTTAAPVAAPPPTNLLDFGDEPAAPPVPAPAPPVPAAPASATTSSSSMFGGMQVKQTVAPVAAPPVAAPPVAAAPNLLDFAAEAPAAPAPSAVDTASSMFGDMAVKDDAAAGAATAAPPAGSGFGFINSDTTNPPEVPGAPPTFDPLKTSSPSSAQKKSMAMSPEQIQAMAYQQMMMQQQYQQMQMAMMQQQRGGVPVFPNMGQVRRTPSGNAGPPPPQPFSFQAKPAQKDDKKFDFVMDAMKTAGHKK